MTQEKLPLPSTSSFSNKKKYLQFISCMFYKHDIHVLKILIDVWWFLSIDDIPQVSMINDEIFLSWFKKDNRLDVTIDPTLHLTWAMIIDNQSIPGRSIDLTEIEGLISFETLVLDIRRLKLS